MQAQTQACFTKPVRCYHYPMARSYSNSYTDPNILIIYTQIFSARVIFCIIPRDNREFSNCSFQLLTAFMLWPSYNGHFWGYIFFGVIFPQKLTPKTSTEPRYKLFQRHVSSYILKRSLGCFVWAAPPLRTGAIIKN
jgi:hypothetical protein